MELSSGINLRNMRNKNGWWEWRLVVCGVASDESWEKICFELKYLLLALAKHAKHGISFTMHSRNNPNTGCDMRYAGIVRWGDLPGSHLIFLSIKQTWYGAYKAVFARVPIRKLSLPKRSAFCSLNCSPVPVNSKLVDSSCAISHLWRHPNLF